MGLLRSALTIDKENAVPPRANPTRTAGAHPKRGAQAPLRDREGELLDTLATDKRNAVPPRANFTRTADPHPQRGAQAQLAPPGDREGELLDTLAAAEETGGVGFTPRAPPSGIGRSPSGIGREGARESGGEVNSQTRARAGGDAVYPASPISQPQASLPPPPSSSSTAQSPQPRSQARRSKSEAPQSISQAPATPLSTPPSSPAATSAASKGGLVPALQDLFARARAEGHTPPRGAAPSGRYIYTIDIYIYHIYIHMDIYMCVYMYNSICKYKKTHSHLNIHTFYIAYTNAPLARVCATPIRSEPL